MPEDTPSGYTAIIHDYHRAMQTKDADLLASLYAEDAVHEFPFSHDTTARLQGREAIRKLYKTVWARTPVAVDAIANVRSHAMADPEMAVCEFDINSRNTATGIAFTASCVLILRVRNAQLVHVRDYIDALTIARAVGQPVLGEQR
jgi:uncharacterized protein (TIGR02246 family)